MFNMGSPVKLINQINLILDLHLLAFVITNIRAVQQPADEPDQQKDEKITDRCIDIPGYNQEPEE